MTDTQTPPASIAPDRNLEVAGRVGRAWREIRRGANTGDLRDVIFGVGDNAIEPGQMDALDLLVTIESCSMGDLADHLRVDPSTATRAVQRLIKDGLVVKVAHSGDGRVVAIAATDRARAIHAEVFARRREIILMILDNFTEDESSKLAEFLERFTNAVDAAVKTKKRRR